MRIYLLRHGETDWNLVRRLQGSMDTPLNELGIRQSENWRPYFSRLPLAGIYSSSLKRALLTASLATGRPACIIPGFDERGFGEWEGRTWDELKADISDFDTQWNEDAFSPPGGESRKRLFDRVRSALRETIVDHKPGDEILIVAHGASGHAILSYLLNQPIEARTNLPVLYNASVTIVERQTDRWNLVGQILADGRTP